MAVLLVILVSGCPDGGGDPGGGGGGGGGDGGPGPGGSQRFCLYTSYTFTKCVGVPQFQDRHEMCVEMHAGDSCPPPPAATSVFGDCYSNHATIADGEHTGTSCEQVRADLRAAECARKGEGTCDVAECSDGKDNNHNGLIDCQEPACQGHSGATPGSVLCARPERSDVSCLSYWDEDGDGHAGCDDPDCAAACAQSEGVDASTCGNGIDDDRDGRIDCAELNCRDARHLTTPCPWEETGDYCHDGEDDDADSDTDCRDSACSSLCQSQEGYDNLTCQDGIDNDDDGLIDCQEPVCLDNPGAWGCARPEACDDNIDNDMDRRWDAEDTDCGGPG